MLSDDLVKHVKEVVPSHLQGLFNIDIETQINYEDARFNLRTQPGWNDRNQLGDPIAIGVSGWNFVDGRTLWVGIDLDGLNHGAGLDSFVLDDLIQRLSLIPEVEIIRSKSGKGYHVRVYFNPGSLPIATTREQHLQNAKRVLQWLANKVGLDLIEKKDCCGTIFWIDHRDTQPTGFEPIKKSTANIPDNWNDEIIEPTKEPQPTYEPQPTTDKHQELINWLVGQGKAELKDGILITHTVHLAEAHKVLKLEGTFTTIATGKGGNSDRNCFCFPSYNGAWKVFRYHKGTKEDALWSVTKNGFTFCWLNKSNKKLDTDSILESIVKGDEFFHDSTGSAYVTTDINGIVETKSIRDARYKAKLHLAYHDKTGQILKNETLKNFVSFLEAKAMNLCPEYEIAIRVAEHDNILYIDVGDKDRSIIKVTAEKWEVVRECPVKFLRPYGMLPLPLPLQGGTIDDLTKFVNVDPEDLPLLLAFFVGCFHPSGPFCLLQLIGEQGSAKSSLMRLIHDFVDPQIATGNTLTKDEKDLLVSAQCRRLLSFDNVDELNRKISSLLCMILTGAASSNRKLFTDSDQNILRAKRPIILTAIREVITAKDLLDRTISLVLPSIAPEQRKSEYEILQALRFEGVRGKIFGFILNGVVAALAGHSSIKRDLPRMADFFSWATAAEKAFGIQEGSAIAAIKNQNKSSAEIVQTEQLGCAIIEICNKGFSGQAKDLTKLLDIELPPRDLANHLREIAPDLRQLGYQVKFRKSHGKNLIELSI